MNHWNINNMSNWKHGTIVFYCIYYLSNTTILVPQAKVPDTTRSLREARRGEAETGMFGAAVTGTKNFYYYNIINIYFWNKTI